MALVLSQTSRTSALFALFRALRDVDGTVAYHIAVRIAALAVICRHGAPLRARIAYYLYRREQTLFARTAALRVVYRWNGSG